MIYFWTIKTLVTKPTLSKGYSTLQRKVCEATRTLHLASQRFLKLRLRGFMIIKLFRKAFPNCFAKLPEAGKLFNLAYSSHICAMRSIPEATRRLCKLFFATYCSLRMWWVWLPGAGCGGVQVPEQYTSGGSHGQQLVAVRTMWAGMYEV